MLNWSCFEYLKITKAGEIFRSGEIFIIKKILYYAMLHLWVKIDEGVSMRSWVMRRNVLI